MEDRITYLEGVVGAWLTNLLEPALTGPYATFGDGGIVQLDNNGVVIRTGTTVQQPAIFFVPTFASPADAEAYRVQIAGTAVNNSVSQQASASMSAQAGEAVVGQGKGAQVSVFVDEQSEYAEAKLISRYANVAGKSAEVLAYSTSGTDSAVVDITGRLRLDDRATDPAILADGELWYRTDTDKFRARINGGTENLATEGYVDSAIGDHEAAADPHTGYLKESDASWVDLTDGGATTLHTHAHEAAHIAHDTIWAAKGDLAVGTANDTAQVLTAGTNGHVLTADSAQATGLKWAAAGGGMKKVQGSGYRVYPSAADGITPANAGSAWANGAYSQVVASTAAAIYVTHVMFGIDGSSQEVEIDIATGGAGAETVVSTVCYSIPNTTDVSVVLPLPFVIAIPTSTRIAVRMRESGTTTTVEDVKLMYINQADLVDI